MSDTISNTLYKMCEILSKLQYGTSSLMRACKNGHAEVVRILVSAGAHINDQNKALRSIFQHFVKANIYTANMSTESFAIIEEENNNTTVKGIGNDNLICKKQANRENTTDGKRNISIDLREAREFSQVRSGNGSKPARKNCGKEGQTLWLLIPIMIMLLSVPGASADQSIKLVKNYTVFQNDTPAMFYCYGNGYENGALVGWILNGTGYGSKHAQRGIRVVTDTPIGDTVSSRLFIPSNYTINNGTEVKCTTIDSTSYTLIVTSEPASLTLQGPLDAPSNLSVNISNTSNTTFLLSWGAPFSFDVTDTVEIYYYTLCTNIYGCKNISSDSNCTFPRTCTSSVDFTDPSLNGTNGGQNKTIMDHGAPIEFSLFAVNGAGKGNVSEPFRFKKESGESIAPSQTEPKSVSILPTATTLTGNGTREVPIALEVAVGVVCCVIVVALIIVFLVIAVKCCRTKRKPSELPVHVDLYSYVTNQEKSTLAENQQKTSETHYMDVACHPIISIPAPHHKVQYSEVKHHNEKPNPDPSGYIDVECHPVISIPAPHHEVQYSEAMDRTLNHRRVECNSEENRNESDSRWCQTSDPAKQVTTAHIAPGVNLVAIHANVSATQRVLSEQMEHHRTLSSDLLGIKPFEQEPYYNPCEGIAYTDDTSPFFAFASTITPQCTRLSPTVLVHECNATSLNVASHHNVVQKSLLITAKVNKATFDQFSVRLCSLVASTVPRSPLEMQSIAAECNSDNSHILKDIQSYTDSTNDEQDDCVSNKVAGPVIFEATTAFVENGPPWMPLAVNIQQCEWLPWDRLPFYTTGKAPPHQSTPKQKQSKEVSVSGRNDGSTKNVHHFSCALYLGFLQ